MMFPSSMFALKWFHSFFFLTGDVYIQPTQDTKNPVIYGVFSVSGLVYYNKYCVMHNDCNRLRLQIHFLGGYFDYFVRYIFLTFFFLFLFLDFTALSLKARQFVSTPWPTSAWSSTDPSPTRRDPITSGWPTLGRSPTLDPAPWVYNPHWPHNWIPQQAGITTTSLWVRPQIETIWTRSWFQHSHFFVLFSSL